MFENFLSLHAQIMEVDRIPIALAAIFLVQIAGAITGPLAGNIHPFLWKIYGGVLGPFGDKMNKAYRSDKDLMLRGFLVTMTALIWAFILGYGFEYLTHLIPLRNITEIVLLSLLLSVGTMWFALLRLYFALEKKDKLVDGAYYSIAQSCRANLNASDDFGITRLSIGLSVQTFDKGLVTPLFWYLIGGLPVAMIYGALAAMAWRFGRNGQGGGFSRVPIALEKLMGFVPSLFSATLITLASAFTPTAKVGHSLVAWFGMKNRASYAQGGYPLSALAWSLKLSLGGPYQDINGIPVKAPWVGPEGATAKNDHTHLRRALIISVIAHALFIVSLASAYLWGSAF